MTYGRQTLASVAQLLGSLTTDAADILLYKHLGVRRDPRYASGMTGFLDLIEGADDGAQQSLVEEIVREKRAISADADRQSVFDGRWRELERWLLHDGWAIEEGRLVRLTPEAEETTGVRDRLIDELGVSILDADAAVRKCIDDAAKLFVAEPADYNGSTTKVRIGLETVARRAAAAIAHRKGLAYLKDSWGSALHFLKDVGVLDSDEEELLARVYTFISPGAHVPAGITNEEWARLARTFGLSSCYFIFKKYEAQP